MGEEFQKLKPSLPLGQVPVLKVDGKMFCQSAAITRYAAQYARLSDCDVNETLTSNMIVDTITEVVEKSTLAPFKAMIAVSEAEKEKKPEVFYGMVKTECVENLKKLEKMLEHVCCTDSVIDGKTTLADMSILNMFLLFSDEKVNCKDEFTQNVPTGVKIIEKLMKDETI